MLVMNNNEDDSDDDDKKTQPTKRVAATNTNQYLINQDQHTYDLFCSAEGQDPKGGSETSSDKKTYKAVIFGVLQRRRGKDTIKIRVE